MSEVNLGAVVVATIASFAAASAYYVVFGQKLVEFGGAPAHEPPAWLVPVVELTKGLVIALVVAWIVATGDLTSGSEGVSLGLPLWTPSP